MEREIGGRNVQNMSERLDHDHAELGNLLVEVKAALDSKDVARSQASLDLFWARLAVHIRAEHLHVFPAIEGAFSRSHEKGPSTIEALKVIEELRRDHNFFMSELSEAVVITRGAMTIADRHAAEQQLQDLEAKIAAVEARLVEHNRLEENGIYLWTESLLSAARRLTLAENVKKELENMPRRWRGLTLVS